MLPTSEIWDAKATVENRQDPYNVETQDVEWEIESPFVMDEFFYNLHETVRDAFYETNKHYNFEIIELNFKRKKVILE